MTTKEELIFIVSEFCNLYQCHDVAPELKTIVELGFANGYDGTFGGVAVKVQALEELLDTRAVLDLYFDAFDIGYELRCIDGLTLDGNHPREV